MERVYREAIADLFSGPEDIHQVMEMMRIRGVYWHISNAADQADQAANVIGIVVMKMTLAPLILIKQGCKKMAIRQ